MKKTLSLGKKDNFIVETAKFVDKKVTNYENKLKSEAKAIAIQYTVLGAALGVVVGIVGTSLWEKYMTPQAALPAPKA